MKIKTAVLLMFLVIPNVGCDRGSSDPGQVSNVPQKTSSGFEMTVERVDELKGVILKGIAVIGTINNGCIINMDKYAVKRDGQKVFETDARILEVANKPGAQEASKGDYVHLYIPDGRPEYVRPGDIIVSNTTSCK